MFANEALSWAECRPRWSWALRCHAHSRVVEALFSEFHSALQRKHLVSLYDAGEHTQAELAELFSVSRTTVYREIQCRGAATRPADGP
jgi:hypothetical protein